jgi:hypothetical protein
MSDYLDTVDAQIEAGTVSPQALVLLFRAAEEAEEQNDIGELQRALQLAKRVAADAGNALRTEAERLITLCEQSLQRARGRVEAVASSATGGTSTCPGCGRPIATSAVRCRACGTLLA